jgi:hypothetical protein
VQEYEQCSEVDTAAAHALEAYLRQCYGQECITKHAGQVVDFLGMTFDFTVEGEARVTMERLVAEIIAGAGVTAERKTPATEDLFDVRDAPKLDTGKRDYFRSYTAKLLYLAKRVRPEMLTAVSSPSTASMSDAVSSAVW